ncbi:hypothetical protein [Sphingomonas sp.]|uniref:hypothetical protein n=1 Tax=Sphingomonas sp. TaxID=28214 RepID=UPI003CC6B069
MSRRNEERTRRSRSAQTLLLVFSIIFCFFIAYGWFNLFLKFGVFVALICAFVAALLAWSLAREVGENVNRRILFAPLLLVSAAGVYNSLMLYLEGGQVLVDAANRSEAQFAQLQTSAETGLATSGAAAHINHVRSLSEALFSEIRNPLNCGQGPEARRLIVELQRELPNFTQLSETGQTCAHNDEVVGDYRTRIDGLIARASWNDPALASTAADAAGARQAVGVLRGQVAANYQPTQVPHVVGELEAQDAAYRDLRFRLSRRVDVRAIPEGLPLTAAQSLGNVAKLPSLFFSRLDQPSTWVFLLIAAGFDLLMVYLFSMAAASRIEAQPRAHSLATGM